MSTPCPRCCQPLEPEQVDDLTVRMCRDCRGLLIEHPSLIHILENSWQSVPETDAEKLQYHPEDGSEKERIFLCPQCYRPMDKYGYMGISAITIDRCDECALMWLDTNEFQNMILALAKTNYRVQHVRNEAERDDFEPMAGTMAQAGVDSDLWLFETSSAGKRDVRRQALAEGLLGMLAGSK